MWENKLENLLWKLRFFIPVHRKYIQQIYDAFLGNYMQKNYLFIFFFTLDNEILSVKIVSVSKLTGLIYFGR